MKNDLEKICVSEEEINAMNKRLGEQIANDYRDKNPLLVGLLKGCVPFMTDMVKFIDCPCNVDYIKVSSYNGVASGSLVFKGEIPDVAGRHVIIVDDIIDTGRTLDKIKKLFTEMGAASVKLCAMLDKPEGRLIDIQADYVGGPVPNEFVVGYGLDYNEKYRNLPYIGVLKKEIYTK